MMVEDSSSVSSKVPVIKGEMCGSVSFPGRSSPISFPLTHLFCFLVITVSGHTFILGCLGGAQQPEAGNGRYVLMDSLANGPLTGREDLGFVLTCASPKTLVKVLLASVSSRPNASNNDMTRIFEAIAFGRLEDCEISVFFSVHFVLYSYPIPAGSLNDHHQVLGRIEQNINSGNVLAQVMSPDVAEALEASMAEAEAAEAVLNEDVIPSVLEPEIESRRNSNITRRRSRSHVAETLPPPPRLPQMWLPPVRVHPAGARGALVSRRGEGVVTETLPPLPPPRLTQRWLPPVRLHPAGAGGALVSGYASGAGGTVVVS